MAGCGSSGIATLCSSPFGRVRRRGSLLGAVASWFGGGFGGGMEVLAPLFENWSVRIVIAGQLSAGGVGQASVGQHGQRGVHKAQHATIRTSGPPAPQLPDSSTPLTPRGSSPSLPSGPSMLTCDIRGALGRNSRRRAAVRTPSRDFYPPRARTLCGGTYWCRQPTSLRSRSRAQAGQRPPHARMMRGFRAPPARLLPWAPFMPSDFGVGSS